MLALRILEKEFYAYFRTSLGHFIIGVYLLLSMLSAFYGGYFFEVNNNALPSFFMFQPDVFALIVPAITMKLWADEYKSGTIELLLTQPVNAFTLVLGKFFAAWLFCTLLLFSSISIWGSVGFYAQPDNLAIVASYASCWIVCGAFCAIGCTVSAFSKNPISSYLVSLIAIFLFRIANLDFLLKLFGFSNDLLIRVLKSLNFDAHYQNLISGQFSPDDICYFLLLIAGSLILNTAAVDYKKS